MAAAVGTDQNQDEVVADWIREAQAAFVSFSDEAWLEWGVGYLMPQLQAKVLQRKNVESKEKRKAELASACAELRADFKAKRITVVELQKRLKDVEDVEGKEATGTKGLDGDDGDRSMKDHSLDGEAADSDDDEDSAPMNLVVPKNRGPKRKSDDDGNGLRDVEGQVSLFSCTPCLC
jgi:hypothetical protein